MRVPESIYGKTYLISVNFAVPASSTKNFVLNTFGIFSLEYICR